MRKQKSVYCDGSKLKEELDKAGYLRDVSIYDLRSVGVQGDERSYVYPAEITLYKNETFVWDPDFMERVSLRITN